MTGKQIMRPMWLHVLLFIACIMPSWGKKSDKHHYLQIVENHREKGKVKQHVIATIGRMERLQEKDPAARKKLMHRHMQMMRDAMNMMTIMGGASVKPMDDRMGIM